MARFVVFEGYLWPVTMLLAAGLSALVVQRKNYRAYPLFLAYLITTLLQNLVFALSYRLWGFSSSASFRVAWATQSLVVTLRAFAVVEIFRTVLAKYVGIWALGWRMILATAAGVLMYSWAIGRGSWYLVAVNADRSLELAAAVAILGLFVFARYYGIAIEQSCRLLATGFFIYSSFRVLNDTVLERWLTAYTAMWNFLTTLVYLASLLVWTQALLQTVPAATSALELLPEYGYRSLSPAINVRLRTLNEQLSHFWHAEGRNS
ncbi:MAG TPA: hypothetical protein VJN89_07935 [Candidatus Acidoferrum sp.]|nr:hypothetical protein [Candidatus Acidoferrum sp.]